MGIRIFFRINTVMIIKVAPINPDMIAVMILFFLNYFFAANKADLSASAAFKRISSSISRFICAYFSAHFSHSAKCPSTSPLVSSLTTSSAYSGKRSPITLQVILSIMLLQFFQYHCFRAIVGYSRPPRAFREQLANVLIAQFTKHPQTEYLFIRLLQSM